MQDAWNATLSEGTGDNFAAAVVGVYGNADPLKPSDWVRVQRQTPRSPAKFFEKTFECTGLVVGQELTFFIAKTGPEGAPQWKVVDARLEFKTGDWRFQWAAGFGANSDSAKRNFELTTVVTFTDVTKPKPGFFIPAPPPLLPAIPHDVFFPFDVATAGAGRSAPGVVALLASALAAGAFARML